MGLNHVALTVSDHERSAAFYGEHFGLTERVHEDEHLLILSPPGGGSFLAETEWQDGWGFVRVQGSDPDGYRVELHAYG